MRPRQSWPGAPAPQLGFNYLGRFAAGADGIDWAPANLDERADQDDTARRAAAMRRCRWRT
jgi:hypothetical protein